MAKKAKRILSLVLVFSLVMSMFSISAYATGSGSSVYTCGLEEHTHDGVTCQLGWGDCGITMDLKCDKHVHDASCYHNHGEECYKLTCTQDVKTLNCEKEHVHDDSCKHTHTDGKCVPKECTLTEESIVCGKEHVHDDSCKHTHTDGKCDSMACILTEEDVVCGIEAHTHSDSCYVVTHTHTYEEGNSCYELNCSTVLNCTINTEEHPTHIAEIDNGSNNGCYKEHEHVEGQCPKVCILPEHVHVTSCVPTNTLPEANNSTNNRISLAVSKPDDKAVVGTGSGINMKIFDYGNAVNDNGLDGYFEFRGACTDNTSTTNADNTVSWEHSDYNTTWDNDGFVDSRVKVMSALGDGYPVLDLSRTAGTAQAKDNTSLGFLFGAGGNGVTEYDSNNTLLQYIDGYYVYDSKENAADYDTVNNRFYVRNYVERGSSSTTYAGTNNSFGDFFPFTYLKDNPERKTNNGYEYDYNSVTDVNYWFGMTMETTFWMPEDGKINGENIIFEFSGDDDVWVFVDGKLALDLGGTHGVTSGSINFSTGEIKQYLDWQGTDEYDTVEGLKAEYMTADSTLTDEAAETKASANATSFPTTLSARGITLDPDVEHTLKFFYLERGSAVANCYIKFNMPVIPVDLTVEKQMNGIVPAEAADDDYTFTLTKADNLEGTNAVPAAGVKYDVVRVSDDAVIAENQTTTDQGQFTLKQGQKALLKVHANNVNGETPTEYYFVEEAGSDVILSTTNTVNGTASAVGTKTDAMPVCEETLTEVVFTNTLNLGSLKIVKDVTGDKAETGFEAGAFRFNIKDASGNCVATASLPVAGQDGSLVWETTVENLLKGTYTVEEERDNLDLGWTQVISITYPDQDQNSETTETSVAVANGQTPEVKVVNEYSYTTAPASITAYKVWDDANNQDGKRPDSVRFALYMGNDKIAEQDVTGEVKETVAGTEIDPTTGKPVETEVVNPNKFSVTFNYDANLFPGVNPTVKEVGYTLNGVYYPFAEGSLSVPDYTSAQDGMTITNSHTPELTDITVVKEWADDNATAEQRKNIASVTVYLLADGTQVGEAVLSAANNWTYTFTGLAKYNAGKEIAYSVSEKDLGDGWTYTTVLKDGKWVVTNKYTPDAPLLPAYTSCSVKKVWNDNNNAAGLRPNSITVNLLQNGNVYDTKVINADNGWVANWALLDIGSTWTVAEAYVPEGYTSSVNGFTITNTYTPPVVEPEEPEPPAGDKELDDPLYGLDDGDIPMEGLEVEDPAVPKTSDNSMLVLWLALAVLSGLALLGIKAAERKQYE